MRFLQQHGVQAHRRALLVVKPSFARPCSMSASAEATGPAPATVAPAADANGSASCLGTSSDPVVQYVVLRKDLWVERGWPFGSVVAQACHASSAAMWLNRDDESTLAYCAPENIDHMHKVRAAAAGHHGCRNRHVYALGYKCAGLTGRPAVTSIPQSSASTHRPIHKCCLPAGPSQVVLEVKGETQLANLAAKLTEAGVKYKLWNEQPENYPTCLATKPYVKSHVAAHFKRLNLCKPRIQD